MNRTEYLATPSLYAKRGNDLPHAKLNQEKVRAIRKNVKGQTAKQFSKMFGVHIRTIEKVQTYRSWVHVR